MITVKFYTLLRLHLNRHQVDLDMTGGTVANILKEAQKKVETPFLAKLLTDSDNLIPGTIVLVNGKNIGHLKSEVNDGDVLSLFPPGGGG